MGDSGLVIIPIAFAASVVVVLGMLALRYRRVPLGSALVVHTTGSEPRVLFQGGWLVLPVLHRSELLDISVKTLPVRAAGLRCKNSDRADIAVQCYLRVNSTADDVTQVARSIGCARAGQRATLEELFVPKVTEALAIVAAHFELEQLQQRRDDFKDKVIEVIGRDLNGFVLDDVVVETIASASLVGFDPDGRTRDDEVTALRRENEMLKEQVARLTDQLASRTV